MRFGLFGGARSGGDGAAGDSQGYRRFIDYVLRAEELGYASLFAVEHHFTGQGQLSATLNLLSYLAARTSRMRLGTAVTVLPWHNPALLAEQVATLDLLSEGRFDFGVGKGYREGEFSGFAIPIAEATERFEEAMAFLRRAWAAEGRFSHQGKHWRFDDIVIEPRPVQRPHPPLWLGAGSEASIRTAARGRFNLLLDQLGSIDLTIARVAAYRSEIEAMGRVFDPNSIAVTRALHIVATEAEREAAYALRRRTIQTIGGLARGPGAERYRSPSSFADFDVAGEDAALIGTPDEIVLRLQRLAAGGVVHVLLIDVTGSTDALRLFAAEVAPEVEGDRHIGPPRD
jgi:alkanesulfonate monooxygenase SsuD/methylene tetrahydromethanopterin reductase-like flavin-dependent oxidoreductase (luciferase family)